MNRGSVLKTKEGFTVRKMGEETLFLNANGSAIHVADELGSFIYSRIDGVRTIAQILSDILSEYEVDKSVAEKDLLSYLDSLITQEIVETLQ